MTPRSRVSPRGDARRLAAGAAGSLAIHALTFLYLAASTAGPDVGLQLSLPSEVEFGLTEETTFAAAPPSAPTVDPARPPADPDNAPGEQVADAGPRPDAGPLRDAGPEGGPADAGPPDGPADGGSGDGDVDAASLIADADPDGTSRLPAGAQIAMRLDMARIRSSPLAPSIRALIERNPDWQLLLRGSGLDPVASVDRLMVATPNLERERWVIAGRYAIPESEVRAAVARLATARGVDPAWHVEHGVEVAVWADEDPTDRVIALVPPSHFVICRPVDLERVLAVGEARREGNSRQSWAEALLSMEEGEALSLEVEGARRFVRLGPRVSPAVIPSRLRVAVSQRDTGAVALAGRFDLDSAADARAAREFWDAQRAALADEPALAFFGMAGPLRRMTLATEGESLRLSTELGIRQTESALGYLEAELAAYARRRRAQQQREQEPPEDDAPP